MSLVYEVNLREKEPILLDGYSLTLDDLVAVARKGKWAAIAPQGRENMEKARAVVETILREGKMVYGVNTGFGKLSTVQIGPADLETLQENLIISHALGAGAPLPEEVVRAMMLLRANALAKGYSGIRPQVVDVLVDMLNRGVVPLIPEKGSLGASGDLAPLANMVLVMIGKGEAFYQGKRMKGKEAMTLAGIRPVHLKAKEGLALINGTQAMTAIGALACYDGFSLAKTADITAAMTMEALAAIPAAFDERIQQVRPHQGQKVVAANLRKLLKGSQIIEKSFPDRVQDAYALRCVPQVHGASRDALAYVRQVIETEMNAATDNPLIFPEEGDVISGGNFHGQPVALAMDFLGMAVAELGNIAERRIERLVNPALNNGLPPFLTANGGLNSGYMIAQYVAAALVSENKVLAHPASVDSIPSSANQEDHVSMGTIGARKARNIIENVQNILAIELLCAAQGIDLRGGQPAAAARTVQKKVREEVPRLEHDRELRYDTAAALAMIKEEKILDWTKQACGGIH
ncbi:histidine ammonia-lyase [Candidatus Formimonas warabiya]|uniref:Histidine ammonia-lyase n=1 Tax=Formimonas warabiya TaxID=1761012 RepID=A0A3G1KRR1_FORW1|nr:histidine ammonia-lyase [Candidatus Formimonas warabiya]ATW25173.1 histidine ammonia-lyase [Candidatus Formimonas warabiya]